MKKTDQFKLTLYFSFKIKNVQTLNEFKKSIRSWKLFDILFSMYICLLDINRPSFRVHIHFRKFSTEHKIFRGKFSEVYMHPKAVTIF